MPTIFRADHLADYSSYTGAWGVPIVYPLIIGLFFQMLVFTDYNRVQRSFSVRVFMLLETSFTAVCLVSCVLNAIARDYVGGYGACLWQGFYSTLYTFSSLGMYTTCTWDAFFAPVPFWKSLFIVGVGAFVAFVLAFLPLWNVSSYMFAVDFCMENIESLPYAVLYTMAYIGSVVLGVVMFSVRPRRRCILKLSTLLYQIVFMLPAQIIAGFTFSGSSAVETYPWLYALLAVLLHSNQVFVPIIFGYGWTYVNRGRALTMTPWSGFIKPS